MKIPEADTALTHDQFEMIMEAVGEHQQNFPKTPPLISLWTVMANIGDRFAQVSCAEEEWTGFKKDIPKPEAGGEPKCPNGHSIDQTGPRLSLGWVEDKGIQRRHGI